MSNAELDWKKLLSFQRFSSDLREPSPQKSLPSWLTDTRREVERDYDRILFSTPVRRMADKTQVFPLEKNESVRSRLTHSHEVSNLARSIGMHIAYGPIGKKIASDLGGDDAVARVQRDVPAMLAAIGLAHDLGNPPFGHQGESAIREWFKKNDRLFGSPDGKSYTDQQDILNASGNITRPLTPSEQNDFLNFEGNAQTVRVLTRLQVVHDDLGLNLTYGTLGAVMKYTASSSSTAALGNASMGKIGHFSAEQSIVSSIWQKTGLAEGVRHPLAFIMEACDDIAYLILDAEDAVKKRIVSFSDLIAGFTALAPDDELTAYVVNTAMEDHEKYRLVNQLSPAELNDVSMQKFRVYAIHAFMCATMEVFDREYDSIMAGKFKGELLYNGRGAKLAQALKKFDKNHAYLNRRVKELELAGFNALNGLMDMLWRGISERKKFLEGGSSRRNPFAAFSYQSISENYRRVFEGWHSPIRRNEPILPMRYRELQLLTDAVSGMTDGYVIDLYNQLKKYSIGASSG